MLHCPLHLGIMSSNVDTGLIITQGWGAPVLGAGDVLMIIINIAAGMQAAMFGDGDMEPSKESAVLLCWEACKLGLPLVLAQKLSLLDFETRKDAAQASVAARMHSILHSPKLLCQFMWPCL